MTERKARWGARVYLLLLLIAVAVGLYWTMIPVASWRPWSLWPVSAVSNLGLLFVVVMSWLTLAAVGVYLVVELCVTTMHLWRVAWDKPRNKWTERYSGPKVSAAPLNDPPFYYHYGDRP